MYTSQYDIKSVNCENDLDLTLLGSQQLPEACSVEQVLASPCKNSFSVQEILASASQCQHCYTAPPNAE